jgi:t-SNARE complex subunit (syntaxin)
VTKFTEQEDQVDALRKQVTTAIEEEQKLRKSLDEFLTGLTLA